MACVHPILANHTTTQSDIKVSTKIAAALQDIRNYRKQNRKIVIFSQWTRVLDIVQSFLEIPFARYDGSMDMETRATNLTNFKDKKDVGILLVSVKAGGEGLNLQEASVVLFMDPLWNNAGEQQAIDRVHRIGQKRRVDVIRYVTKGTVEELVVKLQRKKQVHTDAILGDPRKFKGLCIEDLKLFFKYKK